MRRRLLGLLAVALLTAAATPAAAQGRDCAIVEIADEGYARQLAGPGGVQLWFVSGPVEIHCAGGIVVRADSAHSTGTGQLRLMRDVFYQDSTQIMTSENATYYRDLGRLIARGDVVVRDRHGPSIVRGSELQYDKVTPDRPVARIVVRGRPRAYFYEAGTPPLPEGINPTATTRFYEGDTIPAALQVDASRLEMVGEARMLAHGRVQMVRESMRAFGDAVDYDRVRGRMEITGSGRVQGEGYELLGDHIVADLPDEQLERVVADGNARLIGEELTVDAPAIDITLAAGEVVGMIAVSRAGDVERASALARDFSLVADSIQADAPGQVLERIVAVGDAYGERGVDTTWVDLPEVIGADWLRGDTIVGTFETLAAGAEPDDSTRTVLETLTASGGGTPARSLYRLAPTEDGAHRPAVNYMIASRIAIRLRDGEVATVHAEGPVDGIHLEPVPPPESDAAQDAEPATAPDAEEADDER